MKFKLDHLIGLLAVLVLVLVIFSGKYSSDVETYDNDETQNSGYAGNMFIQQTTVGQIGDYRMGVGNIFEEDYVDEFGKDQKRLVVKLFTFNELNSEEKDFSLNRGDSFILGDYNLTVFGIKRDTSFSLAPGSSNGYVELGYSKLS